MTLHIPKIQIYVTIRCNLNCKLCSTYCPYLTNPHDLDYNAFKKDITRFFEFVDTVGRMELTGGEPLLNQHLPDMINFLYDFGNRIDDLRLLSNGHNLPSVKLLETIRNNVDNGVRFTVLIDDYGPELSLCAENAERLYKSTGAKVEKRDYWSDSMYMGGWVDFEVSMEMKRTRDQVMQNPEKCANNELQMHSMWDGIIYPCGRGIYYYELCDAPESPDCVLIHDDLKSPEQLRNELFKYWNSEYYKPCSYCNGLSSSDKRRFPPAKQLSNQ